LIIFFWVLFGIIVYSYFGYALLLMIIVRFKRLLKAKVLPKFDSDNLPEVTMFVAAYNELDFLPEKIEDFRRLNYPRDKLKIVFVTDGSDDGSYEYLEKLDDITVYHEYARKGKISAMNRGMKFIKTPIVVFSDCNTGLGKNSVMRIVELLSDPKVGCVAGEKRIYSKEADSASGSGEGLYWKFESKLKYWESEIFSVVGAAGELFAVKTKFFKEVEPDTILDDFIISLRIAMEGYSIKYNPEAYAIEEPTFSVKEELKRKIRIAAGAMQSIPRLSSLLNPFKHGWLSIQYISHKIMRWLIVPPALIFIFITNLVIIMLNQNEVVSIYAIFLMLQVLFYFLVIIGSLLQNRKVKFKMIFVPYYFFVMNLSMFLGFLRHIKGNQSVNWEKVKRA